jgi:hypothetical protein
MTSPVRQIIEDALLATEALGVDVEPYARQLDGLTKPVVMVRLDSIAKASDVGPGRRSYGATVLVVSPLTDDDAAGQDAVDQLVEDVIHAIDLAPKITWTTARRVTVDDTWPGWEVELKPVPTKHEPKEGTP